MTISKNSESFFYTRGCEIFLICAETLSFSTAAEKLSVSQASVSQTIKRLESGLGISLFERDSRPLKLTQEGSALYKKISTDIQENQQLINSLRTSNYLKPVLDLGLIDSAATFYGKELTKSIRASVGQLRLRVESSDRLLSDILNHDLDMAILSMPETLSSHLQWNLLYEEPWVVIFPKDYPIEFSENLTWDELKLCGLPFIQHGKYTANIRFFNSIAGFEKQNFPQIYELDNNYVMCDFVSSGLGWTITQPQGLALFPIAENLRIIKPPKGLEKRKVFLVSRKNCDNRLVELIGLETKKLIKQKAYRLLSPIAEWIPEGFEVF